MRHVLATAMDKYKRLVAADRILGPLGGTGLFLAAGAQWRRQRRMLAPIFTPANVGVFLPHFVAAASGLAGRIADAHGDAAAALKAAGARHIYLAGRPGALEPALRGAGVQSFIYEGCDALALLEAAHGLIAT